MGNGFYGYFYYKVAELIKLCIFALENVQTNIKMTTKKEQQQQKQELEKMQLELIELMLKRAGITRDDIYDTALRSWVSKNLDLLTAAEMKRYKGKVLL